MDDFALPLMLELDVHSLTMSLINIASPAGGEGALADSIETALRPLPHLAVQRLGDSVIARTSTGRTERVVIAGHLHAAGCEGEPLAYGELGELFGPGASDAKGALAVLLKAAALTGGYRRDVTFAFYAGGEQGLGDLDDEVLRADFALVAEPTNCAVIGSKRDQALGRSLIAFTEVETHEGTVHGLASFASLGIPALAFGPGDPALAGAPDERVPTAHLARCEYVLRRWLVE